MLFRSPPAPADGVEGLVIVAVAWAEGDGGLGPLDEAGFDEAGEECEKRPKRPVSASLTPHVCHIKLRRCVAWRHCGGECLLAAPGRSNGSPHSPTMLNFDDSCCRVFPVFVGQSVPS